MNKQTERSIKVGKRKEELLNLKEVLLLIKKWEEPENNNIQKKEKAKVLTLYPR